MVGEAIQEAMLWSISRTSNGEPSKSVSRAITGLDFHPEKLNLPANLLPGKVLWLVGFLQLPCPPGSI